MVRQTTLGAVPAPDNRTHFLIWAPDIEQVELHIVSPEERFVSLERDARGYHYALVDNVEGGHRYFFRIDGNRDLPDPASRLQPEGVHGPSEVVDVQALPWQVDTWRAPALADYVIYELHIGTFTPEGTFDAAADRLDYLLELGITAVELMPIAQFPGDRNWGYDGVYPYAVQSSYGGPAGLQRFVDACHRRNLAVILDVVYNHLGPEGNYLGLFGPYFTDRYLTPWGQAINFDGPGSDEVRRFFIENALYWLEDFRVDAFRLDAVHAIYDASANPFLREITTSIHAAAERRGRRAYVIAESDDNDPRVILPRELGGLGFGAQWVDDFHHALHTVLTGEEQGYYQDFGSPRQLAKAIAGGYVYTGEYSVHRQRSHGDTPRLATADQFVVCAQNHDQVGNRATGDRLSALTDFESLKLAASLILLSPALPMLFMGEEYGETAPFQYFTSHSDPELVKAVREGRTREFEAFHQDVDVPDPDAVETFERSKLCLSLSEEGQHKLLFDLHRQLIRLRRSLPGRAATWRSHHEVQPFADGSVIGIKYQDDRRTAWGLFNVSDEEHRFEVPLEPGEWAVAIDTSARQWGGATPDQPAVSAGETPYSVTRPRRSALLLFSPGSQPT